MYASKHPFRDTLVIEIDREDVLSLHGQLVLGVESFDRAIPDLLSILEAFNAKMDLTKFERSNND